MSDIENEISSMCDELARHQDLLADARKLLAEIQFKGHNAVCPICRKNQHKADCRLAAWLKEAK